MKKSLEVVAAIIIKNNKIFAAQRKDEGELAKKWEFPGGKIENNETKEEALKRELKEEMDIDVVVLDYFLTVKHEYKTFNITLHSYICKLDSEKINLNEHIDSKWLSNDELFNVDWALADIPIVKKLKELNG